MSDSQKTKEVLFACYLGEDDWGDSKGITVSQDGKIITTHTSSNITWLKNDLGFEKCALDNPMFQYKRDKFDKLFGKGNWIIQWSENGLPLHIPNLTSKEKGQ